MLATTTIKLLRFVRPNFRGRFGLTSIASYALLLGRRPFLCQVLQLCIKIRSRSTDQPRSLQYDLSDPLHEHCTLGCQHVQENVALIAVLGDRNCHCSARRFHPCLVWPSGKPVHVDIPVVRQAHVIVGTSNPGIA